LLGTQNQFTLFFRVALGTGIRRRTALTVAATEALATVRCFAVADHSGALAMRTGDN
jgi:hypothetical protein